jgi:hypothetical protein
VSKSRQALRRIDRAAYRAANTTQEIVMPNYMLLLYAPETAREERTEADLPAWQALLAGLTEEGVLVGNNRLRGADAATTVRIRDGDTEISDGPFATTKEVLVGYFALECRDLDYALKVAERVPTAHYGSVEVRPIWT